MKLLLVLVVFGVISVEGYRSRKFNTEETDFACKNLHPNHAGLSPKQGSSFSLSVSDVPGGKLVKITGSKEFQGFILQAQGDTETKFTRPSHPVIDIPCTQGKTIRHESASRMTEFNVIWSGTGPVTFKGAAVEDFLNFYQLFA